MSKDQKRSGGPRRALWATVVRVDQGYSAVAASSHGVVACCWRSESELAAVHQLEDILAPLLRVGAFERPQWVDETRGLPPHLAAARAALAGHAAGDLRVAQSLILDNRGRTQFTGEVLRCVQAIPAGGVLSYGQVAELAGRPGAARAVGQIMGRNPLAPLVPCHRVIAAGGKPGGFGPGLPAKIRMLAAEGVVMSPQGTLIPILREKR